MYDELVKRMWECASGECFNCSQYTPTTNASVCQKELMKQAADAVKELIKDRDNWKATAKEEREMYWHWFDNYQRDVPSWIPVTERLPEEMDQSRGEWSAEIRPSDDVLVWLSPEKRQSVAWYSHTYNEWTTVDENTVYCFEQVTHWKPLPESPKEEH